MASRISSSVGFLLRSSKAQLVISIPGVPVLLPEPLLDGVEFPILLQAFHGGELVAVGLDGEHGAGLHRLSVEEDGAGAAVGGVAPDVRPGQPEVFAQQVHQQKAGLHSGLVLFSIHRHFDCVRRHGQ